MLDTLVNIVQGSLWVAGLIVFAIVFALFTKARYKVPGAGEALVITGSKSRRILLGGAFVAPFRRKYQFFPLKNMTVRSEEKETMTKTLVPIIVTWNAQIRADTVTEGALERAVVGFSNDNLEEILASLQRSLDGEVRSVVATMTPEEVVQDQVTFSGKVKEGVEKKMTDLGYQLVSLNIADVGDRNGYYHNLAAADREARRQEAETLTAQANQHVAVAQAASDEASKTAELDRDLNVAEKKREVSIRQAAIQAEIDAAQADADIAGQLQKEKRNQELAAREGEVAVVREQQLQAAAAARRDVAVTEAETEKQKAEIDATAHARQAEIDAQAQATVATHRAKGEADALAAQAEGEAKAAKARAEGEAEAIKLTTEARSNETRQTGLAEAEVARAQGEAEAAAILARGEAEAQAQIKMAEALAANNGANLQVSLAEIGRDTTVQVYTTIGAAMATIGEKATFIDMGGSSGGDGDLLTRVLGNVPQLLKQLDVQSLALNGAPFGDSIGAIVSSVTGQSGSQETSRVVETVKADGDSASDTAVDSATLVGETSSTEVVDVMSGPPDDEQDSDPSGERDV